MPDTTNYMILGYAVTIAILTGIVVYLVLKARNLRAEEDKSKEAESATSPARETLPKQVEHPNMPA